MRPPDQPLVCSSQNLTYRMAMPLPLELRRKHRSTYPPDGGVHAHAVRGRRGGSCDSEHRNSSSDTAQNTASVRVPTSSFKKICLTCVLTVSGEISRVRAMRLLEQPWLIIARTSHSRAVSGSLTRLLGCAAPSPA